jgi:hypothetical protein
MQNRFTAPNVLATAAVFLAIAGSSYAAIKLPKNSVTSKQIAPNAVQSSEAKGLTLADLKPSERSAVADALAGGGRFGPPGPPGTQGPPGSPGRLQLIHASKLVESKANLQSGSIVPCPSGTFVTGGGVQILARGQVSVDSMFPVDLDNDGLFNDGWGGLFTNRGATDSAAAVWVTCAHASKITASG